MIIESLIKDDHLEINSKNRNRYIYFHNACWKWYQQIVKFLIKYYYLEINNWNKYSNTSFHYACSLGYLAIGKSLIKDARLKINNKDNNGCLLFILLIWLNIL